ncbi:TPA: tyrosine-type recombinase/integrase [Vibrio parahaemolyticus]|uniref:VPA1269 family protein n=2 Tax=Vibrio parahaemolyticus TaxID=670 RepID=UPI003298CC2A|nr:tyrosine-type recombinase/integrase [Vibrio parahaemolyticus]
MSKKYKTLEEASAAAMALFNRLGIEPTFSSYKQHYKEDPRLPSNPNRHYDNFISWYEFFGKEVPVNKYETLEEASAAAVALFNKLGIEPTLGSYKQHYKEDPRLPSSPDVNYDSFTSWPEFFGKEVPVKKYETLEEASAAAMALFNRLGIEPTFSPYKQHYKEDPRLPAAPDRFYDSFTSWPEFFGKEVPAKKYETLEEASAAAMALFNRLGIEPTFSSYKQHYKEDPRLPVDPKKNYNNFTSYSEFLGKTNFYPTAKEALNRFKILIGDAEPTILAYAAIRSMDEKLPVDPVKSYGLSNWSSFLCQRFYNTWQEASQAARKIVPVQKQTRTGYSKYYKQDPELHSNPDKHYPDFPCWDVFFGREVVEKYTLVEARAFCRERELWTRTEYNQNYKSNKRLPSNPSSHYGFDSYKDFLNLQYWSLEEVKQYCQEKRISKIGKYKEHAHLHPKLKVNPNQIEGYKNSKDILWEPATFQPLLDLGIMIWAELAEEYCSSLKRNVGSTQTRIGHYLLHCVPFISKVGAVDMVAPFFERRYEVPSIENYINSLPKSQQKNSEKNMIIGFLKYVFDKSFYIEDEDTGERTPVGGFGLYHIPYLNVDIDTDTDNKTGTNKPDLPYEYVVKAREHLIPEFVEENGKQVRCEYFNQLSVAQELNSADWYEVDESIIDKDDPNCVWRVRTKFKKVDGKRHCKMTVCEMWSPVRAVALYCLLNLPTRGQQILWLDSGEADEFKLINKGFKSINLDEKIQLVPDFEWVKNDNPLAGMQKKPNLGVLHKMGDEIGMFTNTNKTGKPFVSSYIPTRIIPWIIRLRDWQSKYNPLKEPTRWMDVHFSKKQRPSDAVLARRGTQCFLFRNPTNSNRSADAASYQPYSQSIFANALARVLCEIQDESFPLAEKVGSQYNSKYTPHCMRVTLITALVLYGDVPLHVLMKVVGHAQIIMTMHYTKVTHADIVYKVGAGEKKALERSQDRKNALLMEDKIHNHKAELLIPDDSALHDPDWPKASIQFFDYGLCPYGGTRCHDGGEEREETKKNANLTYFNPVPAGYLGRQNCFRCRHFVTGAAYIGGLVAKGNEIAEARQHVLNKTLDINDQIERLDEQVYDFEISGKEAPADIKMEYKRLNNLLEQEQTRCDMLSCDFLSAFQLTDSAIELLNKPVSNGEKVPMLMNSNKLSISVDEVSHHQALAEVCENAEIFMSANADSALPRRSQMMDKMLEANGIAPQFFKLNEKQQLALGNHLTQTMLARLGGWGELNNVLDGKRPLDVLGHSSDTGLTPLSEDVKALLESAHKLEDRSHEYA